MTQRDNIAKTIGRYRIIEEIGRGGMAVVYRALDTTLNREVAVKLLHPHLASHGESRARFYREAQAVARLRHEGVLEIYDYSGDDGDDAYIVMELIDGTTLRKLLDERVGEPIMAEAAALLIRPVLSALAHAHANGLVHRDVKPENILIAPLGRIKLSDFGIAHIAGMTEMTVTGQILGSPSYMSPEHVELAEPDARADIFSVGIVLYEIALGRLPFAGKSAHAVIKRIIEGRYDDPLFVLPAVGLPLARIIRKCLMQKPEERYESVDRLIEDVDAMLKDVGIESPQQELALFLKNAEGWTAEKRMKVIDRALFAGVSSKKSGLQADATAHFNRVLAMDPGNERALVQVAFMGRNRKLKLLLERGAIVGAVILVLGVTAWTLVKPAPLPSVPPAGDEPDFTREKLEATDEVSAIAGTEDNMEYEPGRSLANRNIASGINTKKAPKHRLPPTHKIETPAVREVIFTPNPLSVEVIVDKEKPFAFGPKNQSKKLSVGKHQITFMPNDKQRFMEQTWTVDIPPGDTPFPFRGRLMWQPARLIVKCNIAAAVTVPGRVTDFTNRPFNVEVKKGPAEQLSVLISQEGYVPQTKQVKIAAGELSTLDVKLSKSAAVP
jgi:serine/threonine-protein kinase